METGSSGQMGRPNPPIGRISVEILDMIVASVGAGYLLGNCESSRLRAYDVYQPMFEKTIYSKQSDELVKEYRTSKAALLNLLVTSKFLIHPVERVLYDAVFLNGQREMVLLLRTLGLRPELGDRVRHLEMTGDLGPWLEDRPFNDSVDDFITSPFSAINAFPLADRLRSEWRVVQNMPLPFWVRTGINRRVEITDVKLSPLVFMALLFFTPKLRTLCLEASQKSIHGTDTDRFTCQYAPLLNLMAELYESSKESAVLCRHLEEVILTTGQSEYKKNDYFRPTIHLHEFQPLLMLGNVTKLRLCNFRTRDLSSWAHYHSFRPAEKYPLYKSGCLDNIREVTLDGVFTALGSTTVDLSRMLRKAKNLRVIRAKNEWPRSLHGAALKWDKILSSQADSLETFELSSMEEWLPNSTSGRDYPHGLKFPSLELPCLSIMQNLKFLKVPLGAFLDRCVDLEPENNTLEYSDGESLAKAISALRRLELPPQLQTLHLVEETSGGHGWSEFRPRGTTEILCPDHNDYRSYMADMDIPCEYYLRSSHILREFAVQCCPTVPSLRHFHLEPCYCILGGWSSNDLGSLGYSFDRVGVRFTYDLRPDHRKLEREEEDLSSGDDSRQLERKEEELPSGYDSWLERKGDEDSENRYTLWRLEDY